MSSGIGCSQYIILRSIVFHLSKQACHPLERKRGNEKAPVHISKNSLNAFCVICSFGKNNLWKNFFVNMKYVVGSFVILNIMIGGGLGKSLSVYMAWKSHFRVANINKRSINRENGFMLKHQCRVINKEL